MKSKEQFGKFITDKRKDRGLSQKQLADKLFVTETTVSKWERGVSYPDITLIADICHALGITEHEFITASNDAEMRKIRAAAKKWSVLVTTWDLFFYISYGVALLTCFIVNICVNKTLDWFFIVLASLILAATFTTTPKFIKRYKLPLTVLIQFGALLLLLFVCVLYTHGDWFWITSFSIFTGLSIIFIPICFSMYNLPVFIKKNNAIISVAIDYLLLTILAVIIYGYTHSDNNWVFSIYLPIALFTMLIPLALIVIIKYTRTNKFLKTGLSILSCLAITTAMPPFVWWVLESNTIKVDFDFVFPPVFTDWSSAVRISSNTISIIILSTIITATVFIILGLIKSKKISQP